MQDVETRQRRDVVTLLTGAGVLILVLAVVLAGSRSGGRPDPTPTPTRQAAAAAAHRFLDRYVDQDGRVVRHDEDGSTVSEGQAYGMLLAVSVDDRERFDRILDWTDEHLRRDDGLLSWRWKDGDVDQEVATDADIDTIHALLQASERFRDRRYRDHARKHADAVQEHLIRETETGPALLPGEWAAEDGSFNPSYVDPRAFARIAHDLDDERWLRLREAAVAHVAALLAGSEDLPPDWAAIGDTGQPRPAGPPGHTGPVHFSYDAARVPIRFAADCSADALAVAARVWPFLSRQPDPVAAYDLDGLPLTRDRHPVMHVAAAAAAAAAGDLHAAERLLDEAERLDHRHPTYYGAAWVALGRLWLQDGEGPDCT